MKLQAKIGVILPQVKECSSHQKLEGKDWIFPIGPPEEVQPTQHLDFSPVKLILNCVKTHF